MNEFPAPPLPACCEQVYLIEHDPGLLCRILGLYAARSLAVLHAQYAYAAQSVMRLDITVGAEPGHDDQVTEAARVLVDKAATFVGVIAAVNQAATTRRASRALPALQGPAPAIDARVAVVD